ncbi:MAG: hypothetical protein ACOQNV_00930 [Mycoplasmoidaceae bacterium]
MNIATMGAFALSARADREYNAFKLNLQNILLYLSEIAPDYETKEKDWNYIVYNAKYLYLVGEKIIGRYWSISNPTKLLKKWNKWLAKGKLDKKFSKLWGTKVKITKSSFDYKQMKTYLEWAIDMWENGNKKILLKMDEKQWSHVLKAWEEIDKDFHRVAKIAEKKGIS